MIRQLGIFERMLRVHLGADPLAILLFHHTSAREKITCRKEKACRFRDARQRLAHLGSE